MAAKDKTRSLADGVIACKQCGRPYQSATGKYCPRCTDEVTEGHGKIVNYFAALGARNEIEVETFDEFVETIGVPKWIVLHLLREERFTLQKPLEGGLTCRYCRKPITYGTACTECKTKIATDLAGSKSSRVSPLNPNSAKDYQIKKIRR